jgi:hypothetical protein
LSHLATIIDPRHAELLAYFDTGSMPNGAINC